MKYVWMGLTVYGIAYDKTFQYSTRCSREQVSSEVRDELRNVWRVERIKECLSVSDNNSPG